MIESGNDFKEIWLSSQVVSGLLQMNKKRSTEQYDLLFIKALLIGLCTMKKIKDKEPIEDGIATFMMNLFEWRVQKNEARLRSYKNLYNVAINGICHNKF